MATRREELPLHIFASPDEGLVRRAANQGLPPPTAQLLTFEHLLSKTPFVADMREMLRILDEAYAYPSTSSSRPTSRGRAVQDQPRAVPAAAGRGRRRRHEPAHGACPEDVVLEACGAVIGKSRQHAIDRVIYVTPSVYGQMPVQDRYAVARLIGRLLHIDDDRSRKVMLAGPGRWGTTMPLLGVPVSFAEIDTVSVLCEIVAMRENLVPTSRSAHTSSTTSSSGTCSTWRCSRAGREPLEPRVLRAVAEPARRADPGRGAVGARGAGRRPAASRGPGDVADHLASSLDQKVLSYLSRTDEPEAAGRAEGRRRRDRQRPQRGRADGLNQNRPQRYWFVTRGGTGSRCASRASRAPSGSARPPRASARRTSRARPRRGDPAHTGWP